MKSGEMAANIARELAEHTKNHLYAGDIAYSVSAMVQLVNLLDVQLRNLTPGGKDSAARSLNKVKPKGLGEGQEAGEGFGSPWRAILSVFLTDSRDRVGVLSSQTTVPGSFSFMVYVILLRNETVVNARCTVGAGKRISLCV